MQNNDAKLTRDFLNGVNNTNRNALFKSYFLDVSALCGAFLIIKLFGEMPHLSLPAAASCVIGFAAYRTLLRILSGL